jgi:hypothetical protein
MILAFVQAEWDSSRYGSDFRYLLNHNADLVRSPDLDDPADNEARKDALSRIRGYGANEGLFRGFPREVTWTRYACTRDDIGAMRYLNHTRWAKLTRNGSRLVRDAVPNIFLIPTPETIREIVTGILGEMGRGRRFPALVAVMQKGDAAPILVEGHARATAYVIGLQGDDEVEVITGHTKDLGHWPFY